MRCLLVFVLHYISGNAIKLCENPRFNLFGDQYLRIKNFLTY